MKSLVPISWLTLLLVGLWGTSCCHAAPPIVTTNQGFITGYSDQTIHGRPFSAFRGIPYARPPVGPLRFKDPLAALPHEGTLSATEEPPFCPQYLYDHLMIANWTQLFGQEDCLFLNVFSPKLGRTAGKGLPVMVFFHGGAWMVGGASVYPPYTLLDEDVILVIVQYRVGTLGFLSTEDEFAPGNLGIKDQSLALRWVQENIAVFGGDRGRVTLFGESAGGASAHYHLLTQHSKGLFHRAILQSGTATCPWAMTTKPAATAAAIATHLGCPVAPSASLVSCLQDAPLQDIAHTYGLFFELGLFPIMTAPYVDGHFLTDHPAVLMKEGLHADVDVMIGVTKDEGAWVSTMLFSVEKVYADLNERFNEFAPLSLAIPSDTYEPLLQAIRVYKRYMGGNIMYAKQEDEITQMFGDRFFNVPSDNVAMSFVENFQNSKVFKYEFEHRGQQSFVDLFPMHLMKNNNKSDKWVSHVDELAYLFPGSRLFHHHKDEVDANMSRLMVKLWTNFAATGNPTPDDSLGFVWQPATATDFQHLAIKERPAMAQDERFVTRKFWNSFPLPENMMVNPEKFQNIVDEMARIEIAKLQELEEEKTKRDEL